MKDEIDSVPMILQTPPIAAVDHRMREVRQMFHRSLACWASDVLLLRQARMHDMTWHVEGSPMWLGVNSNAA